MNLVQVVRWLPHNSWHVGYRSVSHLGERLGWDVLTYNYGTIRAFHRAALRDAPAIATAILAVFPEIQTIADIGCGTGAHAAEFERRGCGWLAVSICRVVVVGRPGRASRFTRWTCRGHRSGCQVVPSTWP